MIIRKIFNQILNRFFPLLLLQLLFLFVKYENIILMKIIEFNLKCNEKLIFHPIHVLT